MHPASSVKGPELGGKMSLKVEETKGSLKPNCQPLHLHSTQMQHLPKMPCKVLRFPRQVI